MAAQHELKAERATLHGHFSRDLPPVLTINPGDTVRFACLEAGWALEPFPGDTYSQRRTFEGRTSPADDGHALTGPVFVHGAQPGQTLAVRVDALQVGTWGVTLAGGWRNPWYDRLSVSGEGIVHNWTLDRDTGTARNQHGHEVRLRPFMGVYGVAPAEAGAHSTVPPRATGGNIDCKELGIGSTLYLPIAVEGALFSVGDGHAAQGDGEIAITAIECPVERLDLTFDVMDDMPLNAPIANTPTGWITFGFHEDLNEAMAVAVESMLSLMQRLHGLERLHALALASLTVDLRITQVVNGVRGVHAVLPHDALRNNHQ